MPEQRMTQGAADPLVLTRCSMRLNTMHFCCCDVLSRLVTKSTSRKRPISVDDAPNWTSWYRYLKGGVFSDLRPARIRLVSTIAVTLQRHAKYVITHSLVKSS